MAKQNFPMDCSFVCITLIQFIASMSFSKSQSLINETNTSTTTTTTKAFFIFGNSIVDSGNNNYINVVHVTNRPNTYSSVEGSLTMSNGSSVDNLYVSSMYIRPKRGGGILAKTTPTLKVRFQFKVINDIK